MLSQLNLRISFIVYFFFLLKTGYALVLNNPYPKKDNLKNIYYSSFNEQPKTLDPARSYSANEYVFIAQIYEPPLQYDYYKRPYELKPLTAVQYPTIYYLDKEFQPLAAPDPQAIAFSVYTIKIKPGIYYQPHPAFAKDVQGNYRYLSLTPYFFDDHHINELSDFPEQGTRELLADDYIYEIKRLANPALGSSICGLMGEHIYGFKEFSQLLPATNGSKFVDLRHYPLKGLRKIDNYTFEIIILGEYPQFIYWLAMPFFSPIPWEVDKFYSQPGMADRNLRLDWYPVGTGPFMLSENNPNRRMVLAKNPNFHMDYFPAHTEINDIDAGFGHHINHKLPLIDAAYYTLEKESIPRWNKFLQGYYDASTISNENYDQTIRVNPYGMPYLTEAMKDRQLRLQRTVDPSIYYLGFNMLDSVVGGYSERAKKLRQAISIAIDYEEYISIFLNGRGIAAQGPIPPGIFGYQTDKISFNPYIYEKDDQLGIRRKNIQVALQLMAEAGYPNGRDPKTGKPLLLHYDIAVTGGPDDKSQLDWMRKQFAKLGIALNIRATQYNRFQEKIRTGNTQIFMWGWNADYPDPENFLFQLYGPNGKVRYGGENAANYNNPEYNKLFETLRYRVNDDKRQHLIDKILALVRRDAPWVWGFNTETLLLTQSWVSPAKPNTISLGTLKYVAIDVHKRNLLRQEWNQAIFWPLILLCIFILLSLLPFVLAYLRKERSPAYRGKIC